MKKLLLILLCLPLLFSCGDNNKKNDLGNLKGKVKEIKTTFFYANESFGDIIKGNIKKKEKGQYNEDGNEIEYFVLIDKEGELEGGTKCKYNKDGNLIEVSWYIAGEFKAYTKFECDEDGNKIEKNQYNNEGELEWKTKYEYDEDGNEIEQRQYNNAGELESVSKYKYDEDGNEIEQRQYNNAGELESMSKYKYDEYDRENNWIVKIEFEDSDTPEYIVERKIKYY